MTSGVIAPHQAAPGAEMIRNGGFDDGLSSWQVYDGENIVHNGGAGAEFQYHRNPVVTGSGQAVIFQHTGLAVAANMPVSAQFLLGNLDSVRKRISALIVASDFSDLASCSFWLPAHAPMRTYRMTMHTTMAWTNAAIYFYAATPGEGHYRLDGVSMRTDPAAPAARTECTDPTRPALSFGPDSDNLVTNGTFSVGLSGWQPFDDVAHRVESGVVEFTRPGTPGVPAGGIRQATGQAMQAGEVLTASFQLGNSSAARKRVTVRLHDADFSDVSECGFWIPAGQALASYAMRTFTTRAWANATFSAYAETIGPDQWTRLDNVTFARTPGSIALGTECFERWSSPVAKGIQETSK